MAIGYALNQYELRVARDAFAPSLADGAAMLELTVALKLVLKIIAEFESVEFDSVEFEGVEFVSVEFVSVGFEDSNELFP